MADLLADVREGRPPWAQDGSLEDVVASPLATLVIEELAPEPQTLMRAWLGRGDAVVSAPDGVVAMAATEVLGAACAVLALAPRPVSGATLTCGADALERLLAGEEEIGPEGPGMAALVAAERWRWRATATWGADGERSLEVIDAPALGMWTVVALPDDAVALVPTRPAGVWRTLTTLLPGDGELAAGL